jgi:hypothetical protein
MIRLGTWLVRDSWTLKPSEVRGQLAIYALRAFNDGVKQIGWQGWIIVRQRPQDKRDEFTIYYYTNEPENVNYNLKYKIVGKEIVEK